MTVLQKREALEMKLQKFSENSENDPRARGLARTAYLHLRYRQNGHPLNEEISALEANATFEFAVVQDTSNFPTELIDFLNDLRDLTRSYAGRLLEGDVSEVSEDQVQPKSDTPKKDKSKLMTSDSPLTGKS